jgi:hypothetical protein
MNDYRYRDVVEKNKSQLRLKLDSGEYSLSEDELSEVGFNKFLQVNIKHFGRNVASQSFFVNNNTENIDLEIARINQTSMMNNSCAEILKDQFADFDWDREGLDDLRRYIDYIDRNTASSGTEHIELHDIRGDLTIKVINIELLRKVAQC